MLTLQRKIDQVIMIGHDIKILIVDVCGDKVRLGIEAPRDVSVDRSEIWVSKQRDRLKGGLNVEA